MTLMTIKGRSYLGNIFGLVGSEADALKHLLNIYLHFRCHFVKDVNAVCSVQSVILIFGVFLIANPAMAPFLLDTSLFFGLLYA